MSLPEKPLTRRELYLAKAAGQDATLPETDLTREEMYLREIANGGGGGGGDVTKEYVDNAIANAVADIDDDISALSGTVADKVDKVNGKSLSTNDYTDADKALVQDSPITVTATASPISTANGKPRAITIYGKSEIVDGAIKSAGEGWSTVDLGTLTWAYNSSLASNPFFYASDINIKLATSQAIKENLVCSAYNAYSFNTTLYDVNIDKAIGVNNVDNAYKLVVKNTDYTDATAFANAMLGVLLCYELADPTQGNAIAVKTDDGTGINGTMATFSTGTPLYGVNADIRDVMQWDGSAGTVTKNCNKANASDLTWTWNEQYQMWRSNSLINLIKPSEQNVLQSFIVTPLEYTGVSWQTFGANDKTYSVNPSGIIGIKDSDYDSTKQPDFDIIYELATPTTEQLTQTENDSLSALKTYAPQTTITINDSPEFEVEAYANTANGQAISDMQPTRSPLLTLSASGWTNNAQTVTYEHDIGKRNTIDVEPANIKAWTAAGILATAETATSITFECDTVPTADLSFRVTSMEVR